MWRWPPTGTVSRSSWQSLCSAHRRQHDLASIWRAQRAADLSLPGHHHSAPLGATTSLAAMGFRPDGNCATARQPQLARKEICKNEKTAAQLGLFEWKVPDTPSDDSLVRISEVYGSGVTATSAPFSIVEKISLEVKKDPEKLDGSMYPDAGGSD